MTKNASTPAANRGMKRQVVKHSSAIQIGSADGDITLVQRKCYNVLLAHAYDELPTKTTHRIPISDLCRYLNFESNNTQHIKDALRGLVNTIVEWNILGADRQQEWGAATLLSEVKIKNGFCYWEYSSTLRKMLYHPNIYARINLSLQNKISSKHSLILYENIFFYFRADDGFGETPWIQIPTLRKLLGIKTSEYSQFKVLNNAVIKKSVNEINEKTDLQVTIDYKRNGRKVGAIKFYVKLSSESEDTKPVSTTDQDDLHNRLVNEYGIEQKQASKLLKKFSLIQIAENLNIVDQDLKAGKIKGSVAGYAVTAIQEDFRKDRKPTPKSVILYEGMRVIYAKNEYVLDSCLSIRMENGDSMPSGVIIEKIQTGAMRVLELILFPGIKLLVDGQVRITRNVYGEAVIKDEDIYISEKEIKAGIKSRKYTIIDYPDMEIIDSD